MKTRKFVPIFMTTVFIGCISIASQAATIVQTGSFGPVGPGFNINAQGFNTALGTLNSVSFQLTGNAVADLKVVNSSNHAVNFADGSLSFLFSLQNLGGPPISIPVFTFGINGVATPGTSTFNAANIGLSDNFNLYSGLSAYESTGQVDVTSDNFSNFVGGALYNPLTPLSFGGTGVFQGNYTLTYNYTATPEPGTYAMLAGFGTTGLGFLLRKRRLNKIVS